MVLIKNYTLLLNDILLTENKERKSVIALVNTRESLQEYRKALSWGPSFSIFLLMIYFLLTKISYKSSLCNYADDNALYTSGNDANAVISKLKQGFLENTQIVQ